MSQRINFLFGHTLPESRYQPLDEDFPLDLPGYADPERLHTMARRHKTLIFKS